MNTGKSPAIILNKGPCSAAASQQANVPSIMKYNNSTSIYVLIKILSFLVCNTSSFIINGVTSSRNTNKVQLNESTVSFSSPLLDEGYAPTVSEFENGSLSDKPLLLYLPGFDGTLVAPFLQFPELGTEFEVWGMSVSMEDRSSVQNLCDSAMKFLIEKLKDDNRSVYIMGESFGGILALEVSMAIQDYNSKIIEKNIISEHKIDLSGLVLINPATCYNKSKLAISGPVIANGNPLLYPINLMTIVPLFTDDYAFPQLIKILTAEGLPSVIDTAEREAYMGRYAFSLPSKLKFMPQETLQWRLREWLEKGCELIESKEELMGEILEKVPILIVAGEKDETLPSVSESQRLSNLLKKVDIHIVNGSGHACTCGSRVDLTALMRKSFFPNSSLGRKEMKPQASAGAVEDYGLEPRYDGASIGLSPLKYWSMPYFKKIDLLK